MIILGKGGAGKTTLAVQLLLALLATRQGQADEPVPVLLSLTGWDTSRYERLQEWLADRLAHEYPELSTAGFGPQVLKALTEQGHILPILDGLDEVATSEQAKIIMAVNRSLTAGDQLILTSRTEEFGEAVRAAGRVLISAEVIEPEPLTSSAAADYLQRCLPPRPEPTWQRILRGLRADTIPEGPLVALADIAATPLGLWLIRAAYITPAADPAPLLDANRFPEAAALRAHLFGQLIDALLQTRLPSNEPAEMFRPREHYAAGDVRRWLKYLARHLTNWRTRNFDWSDDITKMGDVRRWLRYLVRHLNTRHTRVFDLSEEEITEISGELIRTVVSAIAASTFGLVTAFVVGIIGGLLTALVFGPQSGLFAGLVAGTAAGCIAFSTFFKDKDISPGRSSHFRPSSLKVSPLRNLRSGFDKGFSFGAWSGIFIGISYWQGYDYPGGLSLSVEFALVLAVVLGVTFALVAGIVAPVAFTLIRLFVFGPVKWGLGKMLDIRRSEDTDTPMATWQAERLGQLLRLTATALLTAVLTAALVSVNCLVEAGIRS